MATDFKTHWLADVRVQFEKMKRLAEGALAQAHDDDLNVAIDKEANSLAVMVKHMAGNLRSRFTDFLTTDGEKPTRNRDGEFEIEGPVARDAMLRDWESGWQVLFDALQGLTTGRPRPRGHDPGGASHHRPGDAPPDDPPLVPRRPDRVPRQAPAVRGVEDAEHAATALTLAGRRSGHVPGRQASSSVKPGGRQLLELKGYGFMAGVLRPQPGLRARGFRTLPAGPLVG